MWYVHQVRTLRTALATYLWGHVNHGDKGLVLRVVGNPMGVAGGPPTLLMLKDMLSQVPLNIYEHLDIRLITMLQGLLSEKYVEGLCPGLQEMIEGSSGIQSCCQSC